MKKVVVFLMIAGLTSLYVSGQRREVRQVSGFTGIDASSVFNITVTKGSAESLTIETDESVMQYVRSEVRNGVLHLYLDTGAGRATRNIRTLKASIVMRDLESVSLSGSTSLTANDLFTPATFTGKCSGASNLTVNINARKLEIGASGSSKIHMKANVTGDADMNLSGTSRVRGEVKANIVKFNSSGVSAVDLTGSATDVKMDVSGTAKINAVDFIVKTAAVNSAGTGNVRINVTDALTVNSSGVSSISYKGSPSITSNISGAARVQKL